MGQLGDLGGSAPLDWKDPGAWERLLESMGVPSLLVLIERRMSLELRKRMHPEDILQEALLQAWKAREDLEWRGIRAFRSWFLTIIDHRIRDIAAWESAVKRGGKGVTVFSTLDGGGSTRDRSQAFEGPLVSTTPSRSISHREQAAVMLAALESLPDDVRDVVRLRLFEELSTEETAKALDLGLSATKHRFRKGALLYEKQLSLEFETRAGQKSENS